ncbi:YraN family protein [Actinomycetaceae bacterium L2_0104]
MNSRITPLVPPGKARTIDLGKGWKPPVLTPNASNRELGRWGEELAAQHLEARGIDILDRNWRSANGEIDLVCWDSQRRAVFACEVKTRREGGRVPSIESISRAKLSRLRRLISQWMDVHEHAAPLVAIDLVAITVSEGQGWNLCHIEGVA